MNLQTIYAEARLIDSAARAGRLRTAVLAAHLEDSGLPFVIVRPNLFQQNIPESTIPSIDASGTFYADAGEARISIVDTPRRSRSGGRLRHFGRRPAATPAAGGPHRERDQPGRVSARPVRSPD
jgi:uncharacterized protein YbjT (DUF2867 family)